MLVLFWSTNGHSNIAFLHQMTGHRADEDAAVDDLVSDLFGAFFENAGVDQYKITLRRVGSQTGDFIDFILQEFAAIQSVFALGLLVLLVCQSCQRGSD